MNKLRVWIRLQLAGYPRRLKSRYVARMLHAAYIEGYSNCYKHPYEVVYDDNDDISELKYKDDVLLDQQIAKILRRERLLKYFGITRLHIYPSLKKWISISGWGKP